MISAADVVHVPYTADLGSAGIAYACRSLSRGLYGASSAASHRLPRIVAAVAVELAFRRYLTNQEIAFDIKRAMPFADADRFDVMLGGQRCEIRSFLISRRDQIAALQSDPGVMLTAPALVPLDQYWLDGQSTRDLLLFAFLSGRIAASAREVQQAATDGQPLFLVHTMPRAWARPRSWIPLGPLVLKSDDRRPIQLELGGQDADGECLTCSIELPPRTRLELAADFYAVSYVHSKTRPAGTLGVHCPSRHETHLAEPADWMNISLHGVEIFLVGWTTRQDFRQRAVLIPEGSHVFQFSRTRIKNLAVAVSQLKPLGKLLDRARKANAS